MEIKDYDDKQLIDELRTRLEAYKHQSQDCTALAEQLKQVNRKLEEAESIKSHFISNIRNQIINPFASILGLSKSIAGMKKADWEKAQKMASLIYSEAFELDFQLKNIFAAAKIEAGDSQPEIMNVEVCQLIADVVETYRQRIEAKQLQLNLNNQICKEQGATFNFKTDPLKLQLIFSNLLNNAIEYSYAVNHINVSFHINPENQLVLSVEDFGKGISKEGQKVIFDRFKRLDSSVNSLNKGHGLGLSVSKSLVDLLDGKIELKSQKERGTVFTVIIPQVPDERFNSYKIESEEFLFDDAETF